MLRLFFEIVSGVLSFSAVFFIHKNNIRLIAVKSEFDEFVKNQSINAMRVGIKHRSCNKGVGRARLSITTGREKRLIVCDNV